MRRDVLVERHLELLCKIYAKYKNGAFIKADIKKLDPNYDDYLHRRLIESHIFIGGGFRCMQWRLHERIISQLNTTQADYHYIGAKV